MDFVLVLILNLGLLTLMVGVVLKDRVTSLNLVVVTVMNLWMSLMFVNVLLVVIIQNTLELIPITVVKTKEWLMMRVITAIVIP
jgi:hypothetical protein